MPLSLTSSAFEQGGKIPARFTCEGNDTSPPLSWTGAPPETRTFALIADDPDAPDPEKSQRVYVHWVAYNIPGNTTELQEDASKKGLPGNPHRGEMTGTKGITAVRVRQSAGTGTSSSFTRWTLS